MKKLLLIFGGDTSEYDVSLMSVSGVLAALNKEKYKVFTLGITRAGEWLYYYGDSNKIENNTWYSSGECEPAILSMGERKKGLFLPGAVGEKFIPIDVIFPVLHGGRGENGALQGLLELTEIPFVGCGSLASALCMEKDIAHRLAESAGVSCPRSLALRAGEGSIEKQMADVRSTMAVVPFPWFVKPVGEGSSFGVSRVEQPIDLPAAMELAYGYGEKILVEEGIEGFEAGCAVLGNRHIQTGRVDAISLKDGFFDYHEKYSLETSQILVPAPISPELEAEICTKAKVLYRLFGCRGLARVDFFVDQNSRVLFNEVNTMPGMTSHSRYPGMMLAAGLDFPALLDQLITLAMEKDGEENKL